MDKDEVSNYYLPNGLFNDAAYYAGSTLDNIKVGKYKFDLAISSRTKEFSISCRQFNSLAEDKGFVNGQIIDVYAITCMKKWDSMIMYMPTDDTRTAIGDYINRRRRTNLALYNINFNFRDMPFLPYVFNFHWRLLIVKIKEKCLKLLDPFAAASDRRVFAEFKNFLKACKDSSSFGSLKKMEWSTKVFEGKRPCQATNGGWNCAIYVMYYMNCIGMQKPMDIPFDPTLYRKRIANVLLAEAEETTFN